jgi:hypothetical protein
MPGRLAGAPGARTSTGSARCQGAAPALAGPPRGGGGQARPGGSPRVGGDHAVPGVCSGADAVVRRHRRWRTGRQVVIVGGTTARTLRYLMPGRNRVATSSSPLTTKHIALAARFWPDECGAAWRVEQEHRRAHVPISSKKPTTQITATTRPATAGGRTLAVTLPSGPTSLRDGLWCRAPGFAVRQAPVLPPQSSDSEPESVITGPPSPDLICSCAAGTVTVRG